MVKWLLLRRPRKLETEEKGNDQDFKSADLEAKVANVSFADHPYGTFFFLIV